MRGGRRTCHAFTTPWFVVCSSILLSSSRFIFFNLYGVAHCVLLCACDFYLPMFWFFILVWRLTEQTTNTCRGRDDSLFIHIRHTLHTHTHTHTTALQLLRTFVLFVRTITTYPLLPFPLLPQRHILFLPTPTFSQPSPPYPSSQHWFFYKSFFRHQNCVVLVVGWIVFCVVKQKQRNDEQKDNMVGSDLWSEGKRKEGRWVCKGKTAQRLAARARANYLSLAWYFLFAYTLAGWPLWLKSMAVTCWRAYYYLPTFSSAHLSVNSAAITTYWPALRYASKHSFNIYSALLPCTCILASTSLLGKRRWASPGFMWFERRALTYITAFRTSSPRLDGSGRRRARPYSACALRARAVRKREKEEGRKEEEDGCWQFPTSITCALVPYIPRALLCLPRVRARVPASLFSTCRSVCVLWEMIAFYRYWEEDLR